MVIVTLIPIAALVHFIVFPHETKSILIDYSNFKKDGNVYFNALTPQPKVDSLKSVIKTALSRIDSFWGQNTCNPKFIYCDNETDFAKYCDNPNNPAVAYYKLGGIIVLNHDAIDLDIISHEWSHGEFGKRIGFFRKLYKIPTWFDEGLAMQNDYRDYYSDETLKVKSDNFRNLPDIISYKTAGQFLAGSHEQIMFNYMTAKHVIKNWYTKKKLNTLIEDINSGKTFEEAYGK